jgi:hypothetical protein
VRTRIIGGLSFLGDIKTVVVTQILASIGLMALGLFTPPFGIMLIFLFTNSLGMHLFMPLSDSIGMSLAEPDKVGQRMGQYGSIKTLVGFFAGIVVFFGFRTGAFSFSSDIKWIFIVRGLASLRWLSSYLFSLLNILKGCQYQGAKRSSAWCLDIVIALLYIDHPARRTKTDSICIWFVGYC